MSSDLERRAKRVLSPLPGRYTWLPLDRGEGSWLITKDGRRVLDLTCGIAVTNVGHAHPRVVRAVSEQAAKLMHISTGVATYESNIALAEALGTVAPRGLDTVFFGNSGAEAVEAAIKLSRQYTKRQAIIAFRGSFHGRTAGALTVTTSKSAYRLGYGAMLPEVYVAPYPYALTCPIKPAHDAETCAEHCLAELETMLEHEVPPEHVAAILIEPVLGEGGYVAPPSSFFVALRELATRIGALLVMDEVQTGFGRTGKLWAIEHYGIEPDLMTVAKSIAGGLPLSGVLGKAEIMDSPPDSAIGGTYVGNPVAQAAALAVLDVIEEESLVERANELGDTIRTRMLVWRELFDAVGDVRGLGAMLALELVRDRATKEPAPELAKAVVEAAAASGLLLLKAGIYSNCIRVLVPLVISDSELDEALGVWEHALASAVA
jgi:4-aminobutyrate aminotransferase / (S)-3-amino-2-methylpropionate transaminase / 5-aminovalerate transaminase